MSSGKSAPACPDLRVRTYTGCDPGAALLVRACEVDKGVREFAT
jgi:hypothetical protein